MRDQMIPRLVLSRLRSQDVVHVLQIDSNPEDTLKRVPVSSRHIGLDQEVVGLYTGFIQPIVQPQRYRGSTNVGGVLAYAGRIAGMVQASTGPKPQIVALVFTDGKLEGSQTSLGAAWPADSHVWFWGVLPEHEAALKNWATKKMMLGEEQFTVVRLSDWETMAEVFGRKIGRRFADQRVLEKVQALSAPERVAKQFAKPLEEPRPAPHPNPLLRAQRGIPPSP